MRISTDGVAADLYEWRRDRLALLVLVGLMGGDSLADAWSRLDDALGTMAELERGSRKGRGYPTAERLPIDHDLASRVLEIASDIEPWLRQLAEAES